MGATNRSTVVRLKIGKNMQKSMEKKKDVDE